MQPTRRSIMVGGVIIVLMTLLIGFVVYQYRSPTGFYAREHSDIKKIEGETEKPYLNLDGTPASLEQYIGKPLLVNVWASWSPFAKDELPLLSNLRETYTDQLTIVGLNRMEDVTRAQAYLDSIGKPNGIIYMVDPSDTFFKTVQGFAMPETILFDGVGNIVFHKHGVLEAGEIEAELQRLLNGKI